MGVAGHSAAVEVSLLLPVLADAITGSRRGLAGQITGRNNSLFYWSSGSFPVLRS
jgi:hypothetical protein